MARDTSLTRVERFFDQDELIVSKTDLKGHLTYANNLFKKLAGMSEKEIIGAPHSVIRHPEMPRSIFKLLWDTISQGNEIFAYVVNRSKNGDHYWVLAHVTPSYDGSGNMNGYHSSRRVPNRQILENSIMPLYKDLLAKEAQFSNRKEGMNASFDVVGNLLAERKMGYDEFILTL